MGLKRVKKWQRTLVSFLVLIVVLFAFLKLTATKTSAGWFDDTYAYRVKFTFTHNADITTEQAITLTLDTLELTTANLMQSDCDDIRFTDANGKLLRFQMTGSCSSGTNTFEVVFPSVINGSNVGYAYYDNPSAVSASVDVSDATALTPSGGDPSETTPTSNDEQGPAPISYWNFDEAYGSTANDFYSQQNNDLTITNALWKTSDVCPIGNCLLFDGTTDYAAKTYSSDTELDPGTGSFSVSLWFRHSSNLPGSNQFALARYITSGTPGGYKIYMDTSGQMCFGIDDDGTWGPDDSACGPTNYADSSWHFLSAVKSTTSTITLYIDGQRVKQTTVTATGSLSGTSTVFNVGIDTGQASGGWIGFLDEVKYYNFARSASQVLTDFASKSAPKGTSASFGAGFPSASLSTGLVGYWKLDEFSGAPLAAVNRLDSSGNATTLTENTGNEVASSGFAKFRYGADCERTGPDGAMSAADNAALSLTGSLTISAWIRPEAVTAATEFNIAGKWDGANESYRLTQFADEIRLYVETGNYAETTAANLATSTRYHVVGVYDSIAQTAKIYINGIESASTVTGTIPSSIANDAGRFALCGEDTTASPGGVNVYDGVVDDVRIYNKAFLPPQVTALYNWSPGPSVYLKMDETSDNSCTGGANDACDSSGNSFDFVKIAGMSADSQRMGKYNRATNFDGTNDRLTYDDTGSLASGTRFAHSFSVMAWVNFNVVDVNFQNIVTKYWNATDTSGAVNFVMSTGGSVAADQNELWCSVETAGASTFSEFTTVNINFATGTWYHVACVFDQQAGTLTAFVNGVRSGQNTGIGTLTGGTEENGDIILGEDSKSAGYGLGDLNAIEDEIRIYPYAMSTNQLIEAMNAGHPAAGSPVGSYVARWKMDDMTGTTAQDTSDNNNDLTLSAASWTASGKFDGAWNGTGANPHLNRADDPDFDFAATEDFSISLWFKSDSGTDPGANEYLVDKETNAAGAVGYAMWLDTDGDVIFGIDSNSGDAWVPADTVGNLDTGTDVYDGNWHHVVAVKTGTSKIEIFIDGVSRQADSSLSASGTLANADSLTVGAQDTTAGGTDDFAGDIDEVKVYRSALSPAEVLLDMNFGSSAALGNVTDHNEEGLAINAPIAYWHMDEGTGTTTSDVSGSLEALTFGDGSTATLFPAWTLSGKINKGISFDGGNDYLVGATSLINPNVAHSVSMWVYLNDTDTNSTFISKSSGAYAVYIGANDEINVCIDSDCTPNATSTNNAVTTGSWFNLAYTYDGDQTGTTDVVIYVNGIDVTSTSDIEAEESNTNNFVLGNFQASATNAINGRLDEVKIFDQALTPAQIEYIYNRGAPVVHYKFDECSGSTAYNSAATPSGQLLVGTINARAAGNTSVGDCTTSASTMRFNGAVGKYTNSLDFDSLDDDVNIANNDVIWLNKGLRDGLTISAWVYPNTAGEGSTGKIFSKGSTTYCQTTGSTPFNLACSLDLGTDATLTVNSVLPANTWSNVVMSWTDDSDDEITLWVNGQPVGQSNNGVGPTSSEDNSLIIGNDSGQTATFDGQIDDFKIFNYERTAFQIQRLYNESSGVRFGPQTGSP